MSKLRLLSKQYSKTMSALILLCLTLLLVSCKNTTQTVQVSVPIPAHLTADCPMPSIPETMTYGEVVLLLADSLSELRKCNLDKKAIREIEAKRQKNSPVKFEDTGQKLEISFYQKGDHNEQWHYNGCYINKS